MSDNKRHILQVGFTNLYKDSTVPEQIVWHWIRPEEVTDFVTTELTLRKENAKRRQKKLDIMQEDTQFSALLLTESTYDASVMELAELIEPYEVFYPKDLHPQSTVLKDFLHMQMAQLVDVTDKSALMRDFKKYLFSGQYGAKLPVVDLAISEEFFGEFCYEGNRYAVLTGNFHYYYHQIATFRYNVSISKDIALKLWLEHVTEDMNAIQLHVQLIPSGSLGDISQEWIFENEDLKEPVEINVDQDGVLSVSIYAKGYGTLKIGPLHYRFSRGSFGEFILGGQRYADASGQEFMTYFNPGDFKPPLNVYFSGFRSAEGFEGYWMMKSMGAPFLLICDPRILGGAFYLGSQSYEKAILSKIQEALDFLTFDNHQLILSGLSMGTFGALYYGAQLLPHAIVVGKPLVNLGTMAGNERLSRPNGFPTSLDLLQSQENSDSVLAIDHLNQRFWKLFKQADFSQTTLALAYMKDDDYDGEAFAQIIQETKEQKVKIIGKGWLGRHNDNSPAINNWFIKQYHHILRKDFGREL
ncbi:TPA: accessory Sec system protein Asp2 [Streptococcus suis]